MRILAINGSHRGEAGYTQFLIEKLFEGAAGAGAECESVTLSKLNIKRCIGCFACQKEGHSLTCIFEGKDDVAEVFEKMRRADLIVFGTPVYIFFMSGLLVNLFNRYPSTCNCFDLKISRCGLRFHSIDAALCSKPFVTLISQDNVEEEIHRNIISYFKTYARFMDAKYVGSLVRKSSFVAGHGKNDAKLIEYPVLNEIYAAFRQAGAELAMSGSISKRTQKRANQDLIKIPFIVKYLARLPHFKGLIEKEMNQRMIRRS